MDLNKEKGVALFTDGSAWDQDGSGGWAWAAIDAFTGVVSESGRASETTNNRMEMQAWIEGLNSLADALGECVVLVYCDSQLVGRGFTGEYKRKANLDLWEELDAAVNRHEYVEWIWVKGHGDSLYNDMVDKLASKARKNEH
jgi:ribonuclease HI